MSGDHTSLYKRPLQLFAWILLVAPAVPEARAQLVDTSDDPYRLVRWAKEDLQAFGRGLRSRKALLAVAGTGGLVVWLSRHDPKITEETVDLSEQAGSPFRRVANEIGNIKAVQPTSIMLFLGSLLSEDERFQDAAFTSLEAVILSNLITNALKGAVGRARPVQNQGALMFRPFSGNTSFPSGHATTVFAFTTPWLFYYSDHGMAGVLVLGATTSFVRIADRAHWFSDVLVGGAIGFTTAYWLTRRHQRAASWDVEVTPVLDPQQPGLSLRIRP